MVSTRTRYVSESTTDDETCDMDYHPDKQKRNSTRKPTRVPKCFTKNALMARENRLKKKMYITNLEDQVAGLKNENKKLSDLVANQSNTINEFQKQVKYLQSVIANSEDIRKLIRTINVNTGGPAKSPVNKQVVPEVDSVTNKSSSKVVKEVETKRHPWQEQESSYENYPTPESNYSYYSSPGFEELKNEGLLLDMDLPLEMDSDELLNFIDDKALETTTIVPEQNNSLIKSENVSNTDDVGVYNQNNNNIKKWKGTGIVLEKIFIVDGLYLIFLRLIRKSFVCFKPRMNGAPFFRLIYFIY
ncbi:hypothetical protein GWI33_010773 [Rhynchophorus ferrugineus]|uniref:BZIP domain-containing protein n=1 Tax=Rhynchophorus ferrugineus TaxID=354439 RepID=A0A834MIU2_RHYFE|nr:hypothetical protein GWI33_010773 [Rhynchophorus ferrugineus]